MGLDRNDAHRSRAVTRIAHARLLAVAIGRSKFTEPEKPTLYTTWEKISFRVFGLCHKDARTQVGEYVRLAWDCVNTNITNAEEKSTERSAKFFAGAFPNPEALAAARVCRPVSWLPRSCPRRPTSPPC